MFRGSRVSSVALPTGCGDELSHQDQFHRYQGEGAAGASFLPKFALKHLETLTLLNSSAFFSKIAVWLKNMLTVPFPPLRLPPLLSSPSWLYPEHCKNFVEIPGLFTCVQVVMLRIENLLLRGDGHGSANPNHHGHGRMLEETSLVQGPRSVENGAASPAAVAAAAAAAAAVATSGGPATAGPGAANGVHHESGLGASY